VELQEDIITVESIIICSKSIKTILDT